MSIRHWNFINCDTKASVHVSSTRKTNEFAMTAKIANDNFVMIEFDDKNIKPEFEVDENLKSGIAYDAISSNYRFNKVKILKGAVNE